MLDLNTDGLTSKLNTAGFVKNIVQWNFLQRFYTKTSFPTNCSHCYVRQSVWWEQFLLLSRAGYLSDSHCLIWNWQGRDSARTHNQKCDQLGLRSACAHANLSVRWPPRTYMVSFDGSSGSEYVSHIYRPMRDYADRFKHTVGFGNVLAQTTMAWQNSLFLYNSENGSYVGTVTPTPLLMDHVSRKSNPRE